MTGVVALVVVLLIWRFAVVFGQVVFESVGLPAPAAAFVTGAIAGRTGQAWRLLVSLFAGVVTMYVGGVLQLMAYTGQDLGAALAAGALPFVVGDLTKIGFAFFALIAVRTASRKKD